MVSAQETPLRKRGKEGRRRERKERGEEGEKNALLLLPLAS